MAVNTESKPAAVSASSFLSAVKTRRTHYQLTGKSTITDTRVEEIVSEALTHVPSSYNVQSARSVILFGDNHRKLWEIGAKHLKAIIPAEKWAYFEQKINGMIAAHGTVLFFEDQDALDTLAQNQPSMKGMLPEFSAHSAGMHHFTVWTALTLEGLGANLQHYNFSPAFAKEVAETWNLPETWKLNAQLVFGTPAAPAGPRSYLPIEPRLKVFA